MSFELYFEWTQLCGGNMGKRFCKDWLSLYYKRTRRRLGTYITFGESQRL